MELIIALYDSKTELYSTPVYAKTTGQAQRDLQEAVNGADGIIAKYPEDYRLYCLGTYNNETGEIIPLTPPKFIVDAATLKM